MDLCCAVFDGPGLRNFNGAVERHRDGGLVLVYRNYVFHDNKSVGDNGVTVQVGLRLLSQALAQGGCLQAQLQPVLLAATGLAGLLGTGEMCS
jgi:hypothetical protein